MLTRIHHIGVVAPDWSDARTLMVDKFGFVLDEEPADARGRLYTPANTMIYFVHVGAGETSVEILVPLDRLSGIGRFLSKRGPGLHHICYTSDNLQVDTDLLIDRGLEQILPSHGEADSGASFFHPRSALGILTELLPNQSIEIG